MYISAATLSVYCCRNTELDAIGAELKIPNSVPYRIKDQIRGLTASTCERSILNLQNSDERRSNWVLYFKDDKPINRRQRSKALLSCFNCVLELRRPGFAGASRQPRSLQFFNERHLYLGKFMRL